MLLTTGIRILSWKQKPTWGSCTTLQINLNPNPNLHRIPEWPDWIFNLSEFKNEFVDSHQLKYDTSAGKKKGQRSAVFSGESVAIVAIVVVIDEVAKKCWGMWAKQKVGFSWFSLLEPQKRYNLYRIVFQFVVLHYCRYSFLISHSLKASLFCHEELKMSFPFYPSFVVSLLSVQLLDFTLWKLLCFATRSWRWAFSSIPWEKNVLIFTISIFTNSMSCSGWFNFVSL